MPTPDRGDAAARPTPALEHDWRDRTRGQWGARGWLLLLLLAAMIGAVGLHWGPPRRAGEREATAPILETELRNLAAAQEAFQGDSGYFAARTKQLRVARHPQVTISMAGADSAWHATAHYAGRDVSCRIWVGRRPEHWRPLDGETESEPACTR